MYTRASVWGQIYTRLTSTPCLPRTKTGMRHRVCLLRHEIRENTTRKWLSHIPDMSGDNVWAIKWGVYSQFTWGSAKSSTSASVPPSCPVSRYRPRHHLHKHPPHPTPTSYETKLPRLEQGGESAKYQLWAVSWDGVSWGGECGYQVRWSWSEALLRCWNQGHSGPDVTRCRTKISQ